jgi:hypothetical protein
MEGADVDGAPVAGLRRNIQTVAQPGASPSPESSLAFSLTMAESSLRVHRSSYRFTRFFEAHVSPLTPHFFCHILFVFWLQVSC